MPSTTPTYALPYPNVTDPVADGAVMMKALAEQVEATLTALGGITPDPYATPTPAAAVYRPTSQSIASGSSTLVSWTTDYDSTPPALAQTSTVGLTCRQSGVYHISAFWPWAANATNRRACLLLLNGTVAGNAVVGSAFTASAWDNCHSLSHVLRLTSGDILRLLVTQDSGSALGGGVLGNFRGRMSMTWLRPPI